MASRFRSFARFHFEVAPGFLLSVWSQRHPCKVGQCPFVLNLSSPRFPIFPNASDHLDVHERSRLTKELGKILSRFGLHQQSHAEGEFPIRSFSGRPRDNFALPDPLPVAVRNLQLLQYFICGGSADASRTGLHNTSATQMLTTVRVAPRRLTTQRWRIGEQDLAFVILDFMGSSSGFPLMGSPSLPQSLFWTLRRISQNCRKINAGELFPRVGFIVTNLSLPSRAVVRFYNKRGTAEQWIKEGKQAVKMTRLSCHRFRSNEVRLWLSVIAYNLGNLWRRLVLPSEIENWSLTSLQQRLVKTGGRLVKHARYYWLLLAESHLTRRLFAGMLRDAHGASCTTSTSRLNSIV